MHDQTAPEWGRPGVEHDIPPAKQIRKHLVVLLQRDRKFKQTSIANYISLISIII